MKITINEGFADTEVLINCPQTNSEILKMVSILRSFDKKLTGLKDGKIFIVHADDVLYFESVDKRTFIYTAETVYDSTLKLYEIEDSLSGSNFFRCSKSAVMSISKISSLCPDFGGRIEVTMVNGEKLIVSRQYAKSLKVKLGLR